MYWCIQTVPVSSHQKQRPLQRLLSLSTLCAKYLQLVKTEEEEDNHPLSCVVLL